MKRQRLWPALIMLTISLMLTACSQAAEAPFDESLKQSEEVLIKKGEVSKTITDSSQISELVDILNQGKSTKVPEQASEVNPEMAQNVTLIHFPNADLVYIGEGYLLNGLDGKYYEVPQEIEKYITVTQ
ncbi:hypothetical protein M3231_16975 [Neobacillus mesonae]|nr:hypothetical protein [Neobacillus mesonae]